jgi:cell division protein FtsB
MDLFRPKWQNSKMEVRMAEIGQISDQDLLEQIIETCRYKDVRLAAVAKLTDQKTLEKIAETSLHEDAQVAAVKRLTDPITIARIAETSDCSDEARMAALRSLSDETALKRVALTQCSIEIRVAAIEKLDDQELLAEIAKDLDQLGWQGDDVSIRVAAIEKLSDQKPLAGIAKDGVCSGVDYLVRKTAIGKLGDCVELHHIAKHDIDGDLRKVAVERTTDQNVLMWVAEKDSLQLVREVAASKLSSSRPDVIAKLQKPMDDLKAEVANANDEKFIAEAAKWLVRIYEYFGKGFSDRQSKEAEIVREIGNRADSIGGKRLMIEIHSSFMAQISGIPGAGRNLELTWDGIGDWRG